MSVLLKKIRDVKISSIQVAITKRTRNRLFRGREAHSDEKIAIIEGAFFFLDILEAFKGLIDLALEGVLEAFRKFLGNRRSEGGPI